MIYSLNSMAGQEKVGNKAFVLMDLMRSNYNVPNGFVIERNRIATRKGIEKYKRKLKHYFDEIIEEFPVVVRSSSTLEDSSGRSFAGQFKSILNITSLEEMYSAILDVSNSWPEGIEHYSKNSGRVQRPAVIVQKQVDPKYSGIFFTKNPVGKEFVIEYVSGHLSKLISGREIGHKITDKTKLKGKFEELYGIGEQIEEYYNHPQDIEFSIDKDDNIWILQSRPITALEDVLEEKEAAELDGYVGMKGEVLSHGACKGKIQFIYDDIEPDEAEKVFKKGNILATYVLFPEYNKVYYKAKGVVCMVDSITSHPAIIARELKIPCIGGIDITKLSKMVRDFDTVLLDSGKGAVQFKPRVKELSEHITRKVTHMDFPPTHEYLELEKSIAESVRSRSPEAVQVSIEKAVSEMRKKMESYLKGKNRDRLDEAKSIFYNLTHFLQKKSILVLKEMGYSHDELIDLFTKVDSKNRADSDVEKVYLVIRQNTQNLDKKATVRGKTVWDME